MKHYTGNSIASLWQQVCKHHLEHSQHVMDTDISKAGPCCLTICEPWNRVPSKATNPFIPFWLSVLGMTDQDRDISLIKKYMPLLSDFRDNLNDFSLAMGHRLRVRAGYDQEKLLKETLRMGMQVLPVTLFDPAEDNGLQHRPSTLSAIFSIWDERLEVLVNCDSLMLHDVPFHSELSTVSMWQEMLGAHLGKRLGPMNVVCAGTAAMQADQEEFHKIANSDQLPLHQNLYLMGNETDPEIIESDFKTWPLVGVGRGYKSDFFRKTVIPMAMVQTELSKEGADIFDRKSAACGAATRIGDVAWSQHVIHWINHHFVE